MKYSRQTLELVRKYGFENSGFIGELAECHLLYKLGEECKKRGDEKGTGDFFSLCAGFAGQSEPEGVIFFRTLFFLGRYQEAFELVYSDSNKSRPVLPAGALFNPLGFSTCLPAEYFKSCLSVLRKGEFPKKHRFIKDFYLLFFLNNTGSSGEVSAAMEKLRVPPGRKFDWMFYLTGDIHLRKYGYERAGKELALAAACKRTDWLALCKLGEALFCMGKDERAFAVFAEAGKYCPDEANSWLGQMLLLAGQYKKALPLLSGKGMYVACWRAAARFLTGDFAPAFAEIKEVVKDNPSDSEASVWLAEMLIARKKYAQALARLNAVISAQNHYFWAYFLRGLVHYRLGRAQKMEEDLSALKRVVPRLVFYLESKFAPEGTHSAREIALLLEKGLELAKGNRRCDPYLLPVTFPSFGFSVFPAGPG